MFSTALFIHDIVNSINCDEFRYLKNPERGMPGNSSRDHFGHEGRVGGQSKQPVCIVYKFINPVQLFMACGTDLMQLTHPARLPQQRSSSEIFSLAHELNSVKGLCLEF